VTRSTETSTSSKTAFLRSFPYWLPPALLALALALIYLNPFIGDWDGLDYTVNSLRGEPSSMALGRSVFTFFNHALYVIAHNLFGVKPEQAYLIFKFAVVAQVPLAIIMCWILARDLTASPRSATVAALLVAASPILVIYGGQVMTDVPSVFVSAAALVVHLRGVQTRRVWLLLAGAILLGLGVNLRETVGFYLPWLVIAPFLGGWKLDRRTVTVVGFSILIFFAVAFGILAIWFATHAEYRFNWHVWLQSTRNESARHPLRLANLKPFIVFFFLASPLVCIALPIAFFRELRERGWTLLLLAATVGLFADALLFFNYSTTINWRYFLTGLPAIAPLAADYFVRSQSRKLKSERRGFISAIAGVAAVAIAMGILFQPRSNEYLNRLALAKGYYETLKLIPSDAVVIAGAETVAVTYWRGIGAGQWDHIGVGAGWPAGLLQKKIEEHLNAGRRVFLDVDPRWWQPCSWQQVEIRELAAIEPHFHFRKVAPTVFEIRPVTDTSATDKPNLQSLLPENRAEEVKRCFNAG
jgi:4-amino-4-deoxy-L-arabinose transferase-like glycosyltransferase